MEYKYHKDYFLDNDDDLVDLGVVKVKFGFESNKGGKISNSVLSMLYKAGKPYVSLIGEEEKIAPPKPKTTPKPQVKTKKKKVKIDEPKEEPTITYTEPNEEES